MTTGEAVGLGAAAIGVGAVGYFVLRRQPTAGDAPPTVTLPPASSAPKPPSPIVSAYQALQSISADAPVTSSIDVIQKVNDAACAAVVGSKGVPTGLTAIGCDIYGKYLSPIGAAKTVVGLVEKIPVIGGPVKTVAGWAGTAANDVVKLPLSMGAPIAVAARATAHTVAQVAGVPVHFVAGAVAGIVKNPVAGITSLALAPAKLAVKTVTLPAHYAAAAASTVAKGAVSLVKSLNPFSW